MNFAKVLTLLITVLLWAQSAGADSGEQNLPLVGSYQGVCLYNIAVQDGYLFATGRDDKTLYIFDVSNPASPALLATEGLPGEARDIQVSRKKTKLYIYLAITRSGLLTIYEFNPESVSLTNILNYSQIDTPGDLSVRDSYIYVLDWGSGLRIIDISDISNPQEIGYYRDEQIGPFFISGSYAFIGSGFVIASLKIIDISDPRNPSEVGCYEIGQMDGIHDVCVSDSYAFVLWDGPMLGDCCLSIIDVSDILRPVQVSELWFAYLYTLSTFDNYILIFGDHDLQVVDISDIAKPHKVRRYSVQGSHAVVSGYYAYVGSRHDGLLILDCRELCTATNVQPITWGQIKALFR
ncbi:MAG: hypothetical protein KAV99_00935 [Candidatus Latescibacteria bacterium]|nr:hypothetical protein [Candidatus Latescibacterota bacterium]